MAWSEEYRARHESAQKELERIADYVIAAASSPELKISEGAVRATGPAQYRRIDLGPRGLAYVRTRPKLHEVSVTISPIWRYPTEKLKALKTAQTTSGLRVSVKNTAEADIVALALRSIAERVKEAA